MTSIPDSSAPNLAFIWKKYFAEVQRSITVDHKRYTMLHEKIILFTHGPARHAILALTNDIKKTWSCPSCDVFITPDTLDISYCGHYYCKSCLDIQTRPETTKWACTVCGKK